MIPVVILLSWFFLLIRYKAVHFLGIFVCILGMGCMAGADVLVGRHQGAGEFLGVRHRLCLCGEGQGKTRKVHGGEETRNLVFSVSASYSCLFLDT